MPTFLIYDHAWVNAYACMHWPFLSPDAERFKTKGVHNENKVYFKMDPETVTPDLINEFINNYMKKILS